MKKMKKILIITTIIIGIVIVFSGMAFAASDEPAGSNLIDTGNTAFMLLSTILVFIMTPGLALFYGGMVRRKNVLNTMMNSFVIIAVISIQWVLFGYTIAFGKDLFGIIGGMDFLGFSNVGGFPNPDYSVTIPHSLFAMFQMMFAIITPALITGAFAERIRFPALIIFVLLWSTLVYDPLAHWIWGVGGWLRNLGALDFAGGNVVHISSGVAGLVAAIVIGKRKGYKISPMIPHNIPFVMIGASLLWFGWFGFNAGSALAADGIALNAFVTTNTAAAAAMLSWIITERVHMKKFTLLGAATGAVVGLVAITPGAGFVTPLAAIAIGLVVSPLCYIGISYIKPKFGYDDSLDAFGCHGIGGTWGALATGIFATKTVNPAGADGLLAGNPKQLAIQILSILVTIVLSASATFIILKFISIFTKLRVSEKEEIEGIDITQHGEEAYAEANVEEGIVA